MKMYTLYKDSLDFPGRCVVRCWTITGDPAGPVADKEPLIVSDSVESAVTSFKSLSCSNGRIWVPRHPRDEKQIMGVWL